MTREEAIAAYGRERLDELIWRATIILKDDRRLAGLSRLTAAMALTAAERAIGCPIKTFVTSKGIWRGPGVLPSFCEELVAACALRLQLDKATDG